MQQNFSHKHKSQLIKTSEESKTKAKRKLIGSIAMLLIALIVLLNVTSKVKPIPIKPQIITFKNNGNNNQSNDSTQITTNNNQIANNINIPQQPITINNQPTQQASEAVSNNNNLDTNQVNPPAAISIKPRIINSSITKRPSPEDILNGTDEETVTISRYYVQIATSSNKEVVQQLKEDLAEQEIKTNLQQIDTPNGPVFRLRAGPFETRDDASTSLSDIMENVKTQQADQTTQPSQSEL